MAKETLYQPEIQISEAQPLTFRGVLRKNFQRVKSCGEPLKEMRLEIVEGAYFRILNNIKQLLIEHADPWEKTVYEKDRKGDRTCCEAMHDFVTPNLCFNLICEFDKKAWIEFGFNNCPVETQIRELLNKDGLLQYMRERSNLDFIRYFAVVSTDNPRSVFVL
jgi:hypothetical protein